jgi:hypothetical protein
MILAYLLIAILMYLDFIFYLVCINYTGVAVTEDNEKEALTMAILWPITLLLLAAKNARINVYVKFIRPVLFLLPGEAAHHLSLVALGFCHKHHLMWLIR